MKSIIILNKGSRQAWSSMRMAIQGIFVGALILTGIHGSLKAQEVRFTKPSWYFGVAGGANLNFYRGTTQQLNSDFKVSSAFHDGNGVGLYAAPLIEFHRPDTRFGFMLQAGFDSRSGNFNEVFSPCNCPADLNTDLSYITLEPSLRFAPFRSNFYLYGGPRFAFNRAKSFTFKIGINPDYPEQLAEPDVTGDFSNVKKNIISMQIGAGYDFPLSLQNKQTQFVLSPFVSFHPYFGQEPRSTESWNITTIRAGVALKLGFGDEIAASVVEEKIPEAKPEAKPETIQETKPEVISETKPETKPEPAVPVTAKPAVVGKVYKVYFANNKYDIDLKSASELNRLAADMNENPSVKIEIMSYTDSRGTESYNMQLSENRGKSVIDYLTGKGISASRINTKAFGEDHLVNKCADDIFCSEPEHAENRRATITVVE